MAQVSVSLFGPLTVSGPDGAPVPVSGPKLQGLLAYLALNMDSPPSRDRLTAIFWGERFTEQARQSLRQTLVKLRKLLETDGEEVIATPEDRVGLRSDRVETDVDRFVSLVAAGTPEADLEATRLYHGELLENLHLREVEFQDWLLCERQRMATIACPAFERAADHLLREGRADQAIELARRLIGFDPLREPSHRHLMRVLARTGQRSAAIQQYNTCAALLAKDLQVDPSPETQKLLAEIKQAGSPTPPEAQRAQAQGPVVEPSARPAKASGLGATITVLPFGTSSPGGEEVSHVDILLEDLTAALLNYRWLEVRASPVVGPERLTADEMRRLGQAQGLKYGVGGTLRLLDGRLRLTVQLLGLEHGRYLWVHRYDRALESAGQALEQLAQTIAASVEAELVSVEGQEARDLEEAEMTAWDFCHQGLLVQYEFTNTTNQQAQRLFRRAIELDPTFAEAHARLSYAMVLSAVYFGADPWSGLLDEALELAARACRLDPKDAVCRFALGRVHLARGDYARSIAELETAIQLNPSLAQAHCALGDSLTYAGQPHSAMACFDEAVRLSPRDPYRWAFLSYGALALLFQGNHERSAEWSSRAVQEPNCHFWAHALLASALGHLGRRDQARKALDALREAVPGIDCDFVRSRLFYLRDPSQVETYVAGLRAAGLD